MEVNTRAGSEVFPAITKIMKDKAEIFMKQGGEALVEEAESVMEVVVEGALLVEKAE